MNNRGLSVCRVASLLVSTSCGIGFLLGTGELAILKGMAASLYAVATAIGLLALAVAAPRLQQTGQSVWAYFDTLYGRGTGREVAALSLIWMTSVLSAQIRGVSAIFALLGIPHVESIVLVDCLIVALSCVRLTQLSGLFAICIFACNAVLIYVVARTGNLTVVLHAPVDFAESVSHEPTIHTATTILSVVALVLLGADYQQFPIAARSAIGASLGCVISAVVVFALGFLPASAAIAGANLWHFGHLTDPVQLIPRLFIMAFAGSRIDGPLIATLLLAVTALGSACSLLRAMSEATASLSCSSAVPSGVYRVLPVCAATVVSLYGRSIIDTMVTLNVVYLAAVGPLLGLALFHYPVSTHAAKWSMHTGLGIAAICILLDRSDTLHIAEATSLATAWLFALFVALVPYNTTTSIPGIEVRLGTLDERSPRPHTTESSSSASDAI